MQLSVRAFAITCSLMWGFCVFCMAWWVILFDGQGVDPGVLGHIYRGFTLTPSGSFIGLIWALPDGFVAGLVFAWLYNLIARPGAARQA